MKTVSGDERLNEIMIVVVLEGVYYRPVGRAATDMEQFLLIISLEAKLN